MEWHVAVGDTGRRSTRRSSRSRPRSPLVELPSPVHRRGDASCSSSRGATVDVGMPIIVIDTDPRGRCRRRRRGAAASRPAAAGPRPAAWHPARRSARSAADGTASPTLVGYAAPARCDGPAAAPAAAPRPGRRHLPRPPRAPCRRRRPPPVPAAPRPTARARGHPSPLAKPPVRKLARDLGVDLGDRRGRPAPAAIVTREDVLGHARAGGARPGHYAGDDAPGSPAAPVSPDGARRACR